MENKTCYLLWIVLFAGILYACDKKEDPSSGIYLPGYTKVERPGNGGLSTVDFTAATSWHIAISQESKADNWITVEPMSGEAGKHTLNITCTPNDSGRERSGEVRIVAGGSSIAIPVKQEPKPQMKITPQNIDVRNGGDDHCEVVIETDIQYKIEVPDLFSLWLKDITPQNSGGSGKRTHVFQVTANSGMYPLEGYALVKELNSNYYEQINFSVRQRDQLDFYDTEYKIDHKGGIVKTRFRVNADFEFAIEPTGKSWIEAVPASKAVVDSAVRFRVAPYRHCHSRSASVRFRTLGGDYEGSISISQTPQDTLFSKTGNTTFDFSYEGGTQEVTVIATVPFKVSGPGNNREDWIRFDETQDIRRVDDTTYVISFHAGKDKFRKHDIADYLLIPENSSAERLGFRFNWNAYVPYYKIDKKEHNVPAEGGNIEFTVESDVEPAATGWGGHSEEVSRTNTGEGKWKFVWHVVENVLTEERRSSITINDKAGLYPNTWEEVKIIQAARENRIIEIPDAVLKQYLCSKYDLNGDGELSEYEAGRVEELVIHENNVTGIASLKGVEQMNNLKTLKVSGQNISSADFSTGKSLETLEIVNSSLSDLILGNNRVIRSLNVSNNKLSSVDVTGCVNLNYITLDGNLFTTLDLTANIQLKGVYAEMTSLLSVNLSGLVNLVGCNFWKCSNLSRFNASGCILLNFGLYDVPLTRIADLNLRDCRSLKVLGEVHKVEILNITNCISLRKITTGIPGNNCRMKSLTATGCTALEEISLNGTLVYTPVTPGGLAGCDNLVSITGLEFTSNQELASLTALKSLSWVKFSYKNVDLSPLTKLETLESIWPENETIFNLGGCRMLNNFSLMSPHIYIKEVHYYKMLNTKFRRWNYVDNIPTDNASGTYPIITTMVN